jgi:uncharacterized protein (TIGR00296 family)
MNPIIIENSMVTEDDKNQNDTNSPNGIQNIMQSPPSPQLFPSSSGMMGMIEEDMSSSVVQVVSVSSSVPISTSTSNNTSQLLSIPEVVPNQQSNTSVTTAATTTTATTTTTTTITHESTVDDRFHTTACTTTCTIMTPQATASMCYYCFDVLFYELYLQQQQKQKIQNTNHSVPFSYKSLPQRQRSNVSLPPPQSSLSSTSSNSGGGGIAAAFVVDPPHLHPIIDELVTTINNNNNYNNPNHNTTTTRRLLSSSNVTTMMMTTLECPLFVTWEKKSTQKNHSQKQKHPLSSSTTKKSTTIPITVPTTTCNLNHNHNPDVTSTTNNNKNNNNHYHHDTAHDDYDPDEHDNDNDSYYELRGCIGSLQPKRLTEEHLYHYIKTSAFHDTRFTPISYNNNHNDTEITSLRVSVSLLVQYETCNNCYDWNIGQHGIIIKFKSSSSSSSSSSSYSATFLPEVAVQQQWDHTTTIRQLIYKSGYTGTISTSLLQSIHCTRYQSSKYTMTFPQYVQLQHLLSLQQQQHQQPRNHPSDNEDTDDDDMNTLNHNDLNTMNPILRDILTNMKVSTNPPLCSTLDQNNMVRRTSGGHSSATTTTKPSHRSHPPSCHIM